MPKVQIAEIREQLLRVAGTDAKLMESSCSITIFLPGTTVPRGKIHYVHRSKQSARRLALETLRALPDLFYFASRGDKG